MRIAVILNKSAGSLVGRESLADGVADAFAKVGLDVRLFGEEHGDLTERLTAARDSGVDVIAVGGGDGTIAGAAQVLLGSDTALAILPLGTMNLMARDLDIPLELEAAIAAIANGEVRGIDVGSVNGHVFLCNSVLGIAAVLQRQRERDRGTPSAARWWRLSIATLKALVRYRPRRLRVHFAQRTSRINTKALVIAVNAYDPAAQQLFRRAHLDAGELVLYAPDNLTPGRMVGLVFGLLVGRTPDSIGIETHRSPRLAVTSRHKRIRVMNDGELRLLHGPLRYRVHHKALKVVVPAKTEASSQARPVNEESPPPLEPVP